VLQKDESFLNIKRRKIIHYLGNILCEINNGEIECVGLLDLEEGEGDWLKNFGRYIVEGYGKKPEPKLSRFYQVYHLLNLGFFSALNKDHYHARQVSQRIMNLLD
jgi:hypothetical protein